MKSIELSTASKSLSAYAGELTDEPLVLTIEDEPVAALVSLKNVDRESIELSTNPTFLRLIDAARDEVARGDVISLEEMKRAFSPE